MLLLLRLLRLLMFEHVSEMLTIALEFTHAFPLSVSILPFILSEHELYCLCALVLYTVCVRESVDMSHSTYYIIDFFFICCSTNYMSHHGRTHLSSFSFNSVFSFIQTYLG